MDLRIGTVFAGGCGRELALRCFCDPFFLGCDHQYTQTEIGGGDDARVREQIPYGEVTGADVDQVDLFWNCNLYFFFSPFSAVASVDCLHDSRLGE